MYNAAVLLHLVSIANLVVDVAHQRPVVVIIYCRELALACRRELLLPARAFPIIIQHRLFDLGRKLGLEVVDVSKPGRRETAALVDRSEIALLDRAGGD